jgi:hypothetical protein
MKVQPKMIEPKITEVWLTVEEAAERLRLTKRCLDKWREKEIGPPYRKLGSAASSSVRYPEQLLIGWMKSQNLVMPVGRE